jgi:hypothetical protein
VRWPRILDTPLRRILLATRDAPLQVLSGQLAALLGADLLVADTADQQDLPSADLLLWHTDMQYDKDVYSQLVGRFPMIIVLCTRGRGVRLGAGRPIDLPYIIVPFDPEEATLIIKSTFQWP